MNSQITKCGFFPISDMLRCGSKIISEKLWKKCKKKAIFSQCFTNFFTPTVQNIKGSVKHPIWKMNLIKNPTKNLKFWQFFFLSDLVTKLVNLFAFVRILWKIHSHWLFQKSWWPISLWPKHLKSVLRRKKFAVKLKNNNNLIGHSPRWVKVAI